MADKITSTVAREADGTIQITFRLPQEVVKPTEEKALAEMAKEVTVSGFRKGNAPLNKVKEILHKEDLIKKTLGLILGKAISEAIDEHKIKPVVYPRIEVLKADELTPWEVRATTCELPFVNLGSYKETFRTLGKSKTIWTPEKGKAEDKEPTREEKEQLAIKTLIETVTFPVPRILIEEEVEDRLAQLLSRIEKLGLTLEGYLGSLGKTIEALRDEYQLQAKNTIALELILETIAKEEKIEVTEKQIDEVIEAAKADPQITAQVNNPEQRKIIASILKRRGALDSVLGLM
jgi:FKBP-type peptidyl-prolyl cis-trans isomerase (trigger factor)